MGGICVKPSGGSPRERTSSKLSSEAYVLQSIREESFRLKNRPEVRPISVDKKPNSFRRVRDDHFEKKKEGSEVILANIPSIRTIPKAIEGEQVVAGWPSWLAEVAGEAINGWLPRRADTFEKLDKIGQGTYSCVFKARDLTNKKTVALKRVRFDNMDSESVKFMAREILVLRRLNHPNVIKLEGLITSRTSSSLYLVFEYMEHDLTGLVSLPGIRFTEPQVKCYMKQLLSGLDHCHSHGVLHRDIKGSNLLIDNNGILKIGDFGLASVFDCNQSVPLTTRVVTLWYRPPELLLGATHYGVSVDLWSAGCILGELYAGKPIMPGRTEVEQLHRIFKLCGSPSDEYWMKSRLPHATSFKPKHPYDRRVSEIFQQHMPPSALALLDTLLAIDPEERGTATSALASEFFTTSPLPCDPSELPEYPPSKEFDARYRAEEARRRKAEAMKGHVPESVRVGVVEWKAQSKAQVAMNARNFNAQGENRNVKKGFSYSNSEIHQSAVAGYSKNINDDACTSLRMGPLRIDPAMKRPMSNTHQAADPMKLDNPGQGKSVNREYSGPLMPGGRTEDMLKEHERHVQAAVRRARADKNKSRMA